MLDAVFVMVTAPVAPETEMPEPATFDVTPVFVTLPAEYERPEEYVVVAAAYTFPAASTPRPEFASPVNHCVPTVASVVEDCENCAVDEAKSEYGAPLNQTAVVVEFAFCEKLESWMNGYAKAPEMVRLVPPTKYPGVPVKEMPVPAVRVEVATDATPEADVPYRIWPALIAEVVERP